MKSINNKIVFLFALILAISFTACRNADTYATAVSDSMAFTRGDANLDNEINVVDVALIRAHIVSSKLLEGDAVKVADVNNDEEINIIDVVLVRANIVNGMVLKKITIDSTITTDTATDAQEDGNQKDTLVVVFSATGTTKSVAEKISKLADADLQEIIPKTPYTSEDLNYSDRTTRASAEQNDGSARPEIENEISLEGYTTVFLGYPIWWGQAPRIMSTFVESHDFTGITVIPFCTSGSSDIANSDDILSKEAGSGNWIQGKRFSGNAIESELQKWIDESREEGMNKTLHLFIDDTEVQVAWENNESTQALTDLADSAPLTIQMSMYGGFEQVGSIGAALPRNDSQIITDAGDIMLYSGNQIVIFYGSNSWSYTRLGKITNISKSDLERLLSSGDVTIKITY